jgi:hypothetical protein
MRKLIFDRTSNTNLATMLCNLSKHFGGKSETFESVARGFRSIFSGPGCITKYRTEKMAAASVRLAKAPANEAENDGPNDM